MDDPIIKLKQIAVIEEYLAHTGPKHNDRAPWIIPGNSGLFMLAGHKRKRLEQFITYLKSF